MEYFVFTGGSRGIGEETVIQLLKKHENAVVILGCRNVRKNNFAKKKNVIIETLDLTSFDSVRKFVESVKARIGKHKLRGLVNCAHASGFRKPKQTIDGVEVSYQSNHLSHFLLTLLLIPMMDNEIGSRIVHVTSRTYRLGRLNRNAYNAQNLNMNENMYNGSQVYPDTKLQQILFSKILQAQLDALGYNNIVTQCVHPGGMVRTARPGEWFRSSEYVFVHRVEPLVMYLFGSSLSKAGEAVLHVLLGPNSKSPGGRYWHQLNLEEISPKIISTQDCEWLWQTSCEIVNIPQNKLFCDLGGNAVEMRCAAKFAALIRMKYDECALWSDVYIHAFYDTGSTMRIYDGSEHVVRHRRMLRCSGANVDVFKGVTSIKKNLRLRVLTAMISSAASHFLHASDRNCKMRTSKQREFCFRVSRTSIPDRNGDSNVELEIDKRGALLLNKAHINLKRWPSLFDELAYEMRKIMQLREKKQNRCRRCC